MQAKHKYYTFIIVFLWSHLVVYYVDLYKQQIQKHVKHSEDFSCQISEDFFDISKVFFSPNTTHFNNTYESIRTECSWDLLFLAF